MISQGSIEESLAHFIARDGVLPWENVKNRGKEDITLSKMHNYTTIPCDHVNNGKHFIIQLI